LHTVPTATEVARLVRARRVQSFFRAAVLTSYGSHCAITGLGDPRLLIASHIIPWSVNERRRADPTNGLCLNALFDRAFDRGLITLDRNLRLLLAPSLKSAAQTSPLGCSLLEAEGRPLTLPTRFLPDTEAIRYHRENVFESAG
jgi:predicted restriction endonuclease